MFHPARLIFFSTGCNSAFCITQAHGASRCCWRFSGRRQAGPEWGGVQCYPWGLHSKFLWSDLVGCSRIGAGHEARRAGKRAEKRKRGGTQTRKGAKTQSRTNWLALGKKRHPSRGCCNRQSRSDFPKVAMDFSPWNPANPNTRVASRRLNPPLAFAPPLIRVIREIRGQARVFDQAARQCCHYDIHHARL